jgi:uncharacterized protein
VSLGQRISETTNRLYDKLRAPAAFAVTADDSIDGDLALLRGHKFGLIVTFRRDGKAVPSPVWMAVDERSRVYFETGATSWKVKRISNDPAVLVAASTFRGRPRGPIFRGQARILSTSEWPHAEATLAKAFGLDRKLYRQVYGVSPEGTAYIEISQG